MMAYLKEPPYKGATPGVPNKTISQRWFQALGPGKGANTVFEVSSGKSANTGTGADSGMGCGTGKGTDAVVNCGTAMDCGKDSGTGSGT